MKEPKEILLKMIENHIQPCDCLACREGGRIDQALSELKEWVLSHKKMIEVEGCDYQYTEKMVWNAAIEEIGKGLL